MDSLALQDKLQVQAATDRAPIHRRPLRRHIGKESGRTRRSRQQDQYLALMDAREISLAISETNAELKRSEVKRNVQLAKQDQGAAQMAALEKERLDLKLELLQSRNEQLEIKSPVRGIVLRGDQKRAEGMPVTIGQNLFEVAPLDKMVVEVAIPERDFTEAKAGQKVTVKLDAYPGQPLDGTLLASIPARKNGMRTMYSSAKWWSIIPTNCFIPA